ncbi:MAG: hypothetical protein GY913_04185 [Proteobacteria bacterium]|nr:hypothetical protein [Pseudomonadota bacterium]MCP4916102.1 hypothetical protein [Pseudomonadota bacterium]
MRRRGGQAAVFIALCLFCLVIFVALATNMGILVNDKIRMQNAADAGAYAAAYREAQQLNKLVLLNQDIVDKVEECRDALTAQPWPNQCDCKAQSNLAELYIDACEAQIEFLAQDFVNAAHYRQSVAPALITGVNTMNANVSGLGDAGSHMHENVYASATYSGRLDYRVDGTLLNGYFPEPAIANIKRVTDTKFNYPVLLLCRTAIGCIPSGVVPSAKTHTLRTWYYKEDAEPDIWVMSSAQGTMRTAYVDIAYSSGGGDGGYFGASTTGGSDKMEAIGVAKPFGGSIGPTKASEAQRTGNTDPLGPYWTGDGVRFAKLAMVDEYRARLAGMGEWQSSSTAGGEVASTNPRDAFASGTSDWSYDASKFRH